MRVLLINPYYPISETPSPPLGLAFLAGALKRAGVEVQVLDCVVFPLSADRLSALIHDFQPDLVGATAVSMTVDHALSVCQRDLVLHGQDPKHDLRLSGSRVHFSTAGAAVMIADPVKNEYRETEAQDLYDMARVADNCEHVHMFQRTCVLRDVLDNHDMDINTAYNAVMGTTKHIGSSWTEAHHLEDTL